jgi:hypothetical protein
MKRFIFYAMDQYTIKVLCRKEWEAGVKHGIVCEQQRIIKLLSENQCVCGCEQSNRAGDIALIKGEK